MKFSHSPILCLSTWACSLLPLGVCIPFIIDGLIVLLLLLLLFLYFLHPLNAFQSTEGFYHSVYETFYGVVLLPAQHNKLPVLTCDHYWFTKSQQYQGTHYLHGSGYWYTDVASKLLFSCFFEGTRDGGLFLGSSSWLSNRAMTHFKLTCPLCSPKSTFWCSSSKRCRGKWICNSSVALLSQAGTFSE